MAATTIIIPATSANAVSVATTGALTGDGTSGSKLAVNVDGTTIDVSGGNALEVVTPLRQATVQLTNAQIKALPTTPITVLSAPGANRVAIVTRGFVIASIAVDYATVNVDAFMSILHTDPGVKLSNPFPLGDANFLDAGGGTLCGWITPAVGDDLVSFTGSPVNEQVGYALANLANKPLLLKADNKSDGNFTAGDAANTLTISVTYLLLNTSTGSFI